MIARAKTKIHGGKADKAFNSVHGRKRVRGFSWNKKAAEKEIDSLVGRVRDSPPRGGKTRGL